MPKNQQDWPGVATSVVREWLYIERLPGENTMSIVEHIARFLSELPANERPDGGVLDEEFTLAIPTGRNFQAFSYRGDLAGWRRRLHEFSDMEHRHTARIVDGQFIAGETAYSLGECAAL